MSKLSGYNAEGYTAITAGDFNGTGKETLVYYDPAKGDLQLRENNGDTVLNIGNDGTLRNYFGKTLNEIQALDGADTSTQGLDKVLQDRTIINQPIVGNFDGNAAGREQILFTISSGDGDAVNIGGYYYKPSDFDASKATGSYQHTRTGQRRRNADKGIFQYRRRERQNCCRRRHVDRKVYRKRYTHHQRQRLHDLQQHHFYL